MKASILVAFSLLLFTSTLVTGCTTTRARETQLDMAPKTAALEPQDVRRTVEKMVDSMLADQQVIADVGGDRPVLEVEEIKNRSTMHLDMKMLTNSMRTKLIRSRKFRFMDKTTSGTDLKTMNDQALNGLTDPSKAVPMGQQSAAQMYIYGELHEMRNQVDGTTDRYYMFSLNLKDLRTGEIVWTDEQEIRKEETRNVMGF